MGGGGVRKDDVKGTNDPENEQVKVKEKQPFKEEEVVIEGKEASEESAQELFKAPSTPSSASLYVDAGIGEREQGTWIEYVDEEGHLYYQNDLTGESSWTSPTQTQSSTGTFEAIDSSSSPDSTKPPTLLSSTPSSPWKQYADEEGRMYYYNNETGATSWTLPPEEE